MIGSRARRAGGHKDYSLIGAISVIALLGVVVIYTISPILNYGVFGTVNANYFLYRHLINLLIGAVLFYIASRMSMQSWQKLLPYMLIACVITSVMLLIPATAITINGATRWIGIGGLSFQPAELLKLTGVVYAAFWLGNKSKSELDDSQMTLWPAMGIIGALGFLVVIVQKDLGTMVVVTTILLGMLYFSGVRMRSMALAAGILVALAIGSIVIAPHRMSRLTTFLNAGADIQGSGYHIDQALTAIGSGGLFGAGLGRSIQVYGFLPEAENDSVFAIHSEIFGFVGAVVLLLAFGYLLNKILHISEQQVRAPERLMAAGLFLWIGSHVIVNVGAMLSVLPLTGLTLPFLSYGGSSIMMIMTGLGIVFGLSSAQAGSSSQRTTPSRRPVSSLRRAT